VSLLKSCNEWKYDETFKGCSWNCKKVKTVMSVSKSERMQYIYVCVCIYIYIYIYMINSKMQNLNLLLEKLKYFAKLQIQIYNIYK
jgi:hypothetical protein